MAIYWPKCRPCQECIPMLNGKGRIINTIKKPLIILSLAGFSSVSEINAQINSRSHKSFSDCKSKSQKTAKPTILKLSKNKLLQVRTVSDLLEVLPKDCKVYCVVLNLKMKDENNFEFLNVGNDIVYYEKLAACAFILVENIVSSCAQAHKANYKIMIE